jgi:hypothetical protein
MSGLELVDTALAAYRTSMRDILPLAVGPTVFCTAATKFGFDYLVPALFETNNPDRVDIQVLEFLVTMALSMLVAVPLFLLGACMVLPIAVQTTARWMLGENPAGNKNLAVERLVFPTVRLLTSICLRGVVGFFVCAILIGLSAIAGEAARSLKVPLLAVTVLAQLGLVAAAWVMFHAFTRYSLALPAMLVEGLDLKKAMERSRQLMSKAGTGSSGYASALAQLFAIALLTLLLSAGFSLLLELILSQLELASYFDSSRFGPLWKALLSLVPTYLSLLFVLPLMACTVTVSYFERRARQEGFDIAHLAHEISHRHRRRFDVS